MYFSGRNLFPALPFTHYLKSAFMPFVTALAPFAHAHSVLRPLLKGLHGGVGLFTSIALKTVRLFLFCSISYFVTKIEVKTTNKINIIQNKQSTILSVNSLFLFLSAIFFTRYVNKGFEQIIQAIKNNVNFVMLLSNSIIKPLMDKLAANSAEIASIFLSLKLYI